MYSCDEDFDLQDDDKETTSSYDSEDELPRTDDVEYEINQHIIEYELGFGSAGAENRMW
jgi:hypothetical protein